MPATGDNRRRIAREWARRNRKKIKVYQQSVQPSGLTRNQEYNRSRLEVTLRNNAKRRAHVKGRPFDLSIDDVALLLEGSGMRCSVMGCERRLVVGNRRQSNDSPTLDEVRVGEGYVIGNTAVVCHVCNRRKSDMTSDQLRALADWIDQFGDQPRVNE